MPVAHTDNGGLRIRLQRGAKEDGGRGEGGGCRDHSSDGSGERPGLREACETAGTASLLSHGRNCGSGGTCQFGGAVWWTSNKEDTCSFDADSAQFRRIVKEQYFQISCISCSERYWKRTYLLRSTRVIPSCCFNTCLKCVEHRNGPQSAESKDSERCLCCTTLACESPILHCTPVLYNTHCTVLHHIMQAVKPVHCGSMPTPLCTDPP